MLENENTVLISKALTLIFFMSEAERQAKVEIPHDHKDHLMSYEKHAVETQETHGSLGRMARRG